MSLGNYLDDFIHYLALEKGLALNTQEAYSHDINMFFTHLDTDHIDDIQLITEEHIINFLSVLKVNEYATSSLSRTLIAIKVFFRYAKREGIVPADVAFYLESPKLWQIIPEVLSTSEVEKLLAQPDTFTPFGTRDKAILEVLYATGLRVSEVCSLNIYDVDDEYVKVLGKGGKERIVPIGKTALAAVDHYLNIGRHLTDSENEKALFVTRSGKRIDRFRVWNRIKTYAKQAGIEKNVSPHTLRHSFATHLLDNGADLRVIQEMMGHANINSTDRYMHVSRQHLQKLFHAFHPRVKE